MPSWAATHEVVLSLPPETDGQWRKSIHIHQKLDSYSGPNFQFLEATISDAQFCLYRIDDLHRIRKHTSFDNAKSLASALVINGLDYCNYMFCIVRQDVT